MFSVVPFTDIIDGEEFENVRYYCDGKQITKTAAIFGCAAKKPVNNQ